MDLDNFEFKPLTKGLGFDKKAEETPRPSISTPVRTSAPIEVERLETKASVYEKPLDWNTNPPKTSRLIGDMLESLPPSIDFLDEKKDFKKLSKNENKVFKPVGRMDYVSPSVKEIPTPELPILPGDEKVDVSLNNTLEKAFPKVGFRRPFFHQSVEVKPQYTPVTSSFTSSVLDALVIAGLTALFLVCLILVTKIDLIAVILHTQAPMSVWLEIGAIFMGVYTLYYMCTRGFWGSTLGDWAFDMQLGLEEDRLRWYYPAQVVFRMLLIAGTGFVLFPLISFVTKKDLAYWISGLRLYMKNY